MGPLVFLVVINGDDNKVTNGLFSAESRPVITRQPKLRSLFSPPACHLEETRPRCVGKIRTHPLQAGEIGTWSFCNSFRYPPRPRRGLGIQPRRVDGSLQDDRRGGEKGASLGLAGHAKQRFDGNEVRLKFCETREGLNCPALSASTILLLSPSSFFRVFGRFSEPSVDK